MAKLIKLERKIKKNEDGSVTMKSYIEELFDSEVEYDVWLSKKKADIASTKNKIKSAEARMKYSPEMDSRKKAELKRFAKKIKEASELLIPEEAEQDKKKFEEELKVYESELPEE